ncbi:hypothetical protein AKUH4B501J_UNKNOWN200040 (plasmid) [Apilactobacillus kunkeei]|nr:hypothetical protein AKUH4B501J_UNKNOWN200040 [Apilactobacillus kunkeei]
MRNDGEIIVNRIRLYHAFAFSILDILGIDYISNNEPKGILLTKYLLQKYRSRKSLIFISTEKKY